MKFVHAILSRFDRFVKILLVDWIRVFKIVRRRLAEVEEDKPAAGAKKTRRQYGGGDEIEREQEEHGQDGRRRRRVQSEIDLEVPLATAIVTYLGYCVLICFGYLDDLLRYLGIVRIRAATEKGHQGYVPLFSGFEHFFTRNIYRRVRDGWNRPICSVPGPLITLKNRVSKDHGWTFEYTGTTSTAINMGSYNYLGFAENTGPCVEAVLDKVSNYGLGTCTTRQELGTSDVHLELERCLARFLGVEDAVTFGMGFATNSMNLPVLIGPGCLILSDELNHASLILGSRLSKAGIRTFRHNDMEDLEKKLRDAVIYGQPRTSRPWKKIVVVVEGIYSMEGTIVNLPDVVRLKKKYKAYLYLDEAHSMGALGATGRGVVEHWGCNPRDIDVMMGTFTKSFAAGGGYIAGSRNLISHLKSKSHAAHYSNSVSVPVAQQIISVLRILCGEDGTDDGRKRVKQLADNTKYFRSKLQDMGFIVYGDDSSPVVPLLQFMPAKTVAFSRMALEHGIALVGVGFPATPLNKSRARFCISATHTKDMLDKTLEMCYKLGHATGLQYFNERPSCAAYRCCRDS